MKRQLHTTSWTTAKVKKQILKKHQIRLDTPWLDPDKSLTEQEVNENDELILMYRFYYSMEIDRGSQNVEMLYKQARATYLAGELLCSLNDMVHLSAILCQLMKGDYSKDKYSPDFLISFKNLIAPPKCKLKAISKQIMLEHARLEGLTVADAKCLFVKIWSSLELFGVEFLSCTNVDTKDKGLIGISKNRIMFLVHKKKKSYVWDIDSLMYWTHDTKKDTVTLRFTSDSSTEILNMHLPDYSGVLVDCLRGHKSLSDSVPDISRTVTEFQFSEELESAISKFAPQQTVTDAKGHKMLSNLTYEEVYWAGNIENPMLSDEERSQLSNESWENPAFENLDQLMDERFNFLDFSEYTTTTTNPESSGAEVEDSSNNSPPMDQIQQDINYSQTTVTPSAPPPPLVTPSAPPTSCSIHPLQQPTNSSNYLHTSINNGGSGRQGGSKGQSPLLHSRTNSDVPHSVIIAEEQLLSRSSSGHNRSTGSTLHNGLKKFNSHRLLTHSESGSSSSSGESVDNVVEVTDRKVGQLSSRSWNTFIRVETTDPATSLSDTTTAGQETTDDQLGSRKMDRLSHVDRTAS